MRKWFALGWLFLATMVSSLSARAGDWPQILGPHRDGAAEDEKLADSWPADGPPVVWQRAVGSGYAGVAVADGVAVLFHRVGDFERAEAMEARTGKLRWKADFPATYQPSFSEDDGPLCVPLIHKGRVYLYGARGNLYCVDFQTGRTLWQRDPFEDYHGKRSVRGEPPTGYFGVGSTPLIEGDKLIVNVGGEEQGAGVVAFALDSGKTLWTATRTRASYAAPIAVTAAGVRQVIAVTRLSVVSLDPADGAVRWEFPFNAPGPKVSAAIPVVLDGHLFVTAAYEAGAVWAKIEKDKADILWQSDDILSSQYTTPVTDGKHLYGLHGREDVGRASLRCIAPRTRKVLWNEDQFGYATLMTADDKLVILKTDGELILARRTPEAYRPLASAHVLTTQTRALPALSHGLLYVRDRQTLKCVDVGRK